MLWQLVLTTIVGSSVATSVLYSYNDLEQCQKAAAHVSRVERIPTGAVYRVGSCEKVK